LVNIMGDVALKKDKRGAYEDSRESIVQMARDYEAQGQPFTFWAGHGNDPFYIQIETLEQILEVAPNTCYGFVYAEMANVEDPRVIHFVNEYVPRLATAIRKNNKAKLYFRYKNIFWAATSHLSPWKDMFFSRKYNDILVPASEDTSSRTQDLNLAGRVGMLEGGYVDDFAMRLVDDNPTSWRPLSPGGQRSISPYLRQGVMMAAYGSKHGVIIDNNFTEEPGLNVLFGLMKSGVLPIVDKENIQSIGSWLLIKDIDKELIDAVDSHHTINQYKDDDEDAIFSVTQMHWAGTNLPDYDFSKMALGVNYRWLNYMPELPHGMVPVAPIDFASQLDKKNIPYSVSNVKKGFVNDALVSAKDFGTNMQSVLEKGDEKLPIIVSGAAWSAIRLDDTHTRLILVDPGYIDPQDRKVIVKFQNIHVTKAVDILSKEQLSISKKQIELIVPAGSRRFIDVFHD
jgi:lambda-carrageenase